jgi:hypothetical protein
LDIDCIRTKKGEKKVEAKQPCSERRQQILLDQLPLAMAYVPFQRWGNLYNPEKGFSHGTIFQDLDFPFQGKGGCRR